MLPRVPNAGAENCCLQRVHGCNRHSDFETFTSYNWSWVIAGIMAYFVLDL